MPTTMSKGVGIDLGTTNSAVAVMNPTDTEIILHRDQKVRRDTTPSCVWKNPKTGDIIVGSQAFQRLGTRPLPVRSIKRLMGDQTTVMLTDLCKTPEEISAFILSEMRRQIETDVAKFSSADTQWVVDRAIVTVPAYFEQPSIEATRQASRLAGLDVIDLLHEPTAAACYYCWSTGAQNGTFLVYDLGGGTFDVSVLRCTSGTFEVLGISGNRLLGGDDLDAAISELINTRLVADGYAFDLDVKNDPEDQLRMQQIRLLAEGVKKGLSAAGEFVLRSSGTVRDKADNPVVIDTTFELPEVECAMRPIVERTIPYCFDALELAEKRTGVKLADVDAVILAGGSTHIPMVREIVRQNLCALAGESDMVADPRASQPRAKCEKPVYEKVDTIVALGAAIRAAAVGGLTAVNHERTVRVGFRGTGVTGRRETNISGEVKALAPEISLRRGRVRLSDSDTGYDDEIEFGETGVFTFKKVPLQQDSENPLRFQIFDEAGNLVAAVGRPVKQSAAQTRPTGGGGGTGVIPKPLRLKVRKTTGDLGFSELLPAMSTLPANKDFTYSHPGSTEALILSLYQGTRKIKEIKVPVSASLPKGTVINLNLNVDELSLITVKGNVGDVAFDAKVDPPQDRQPPTVQDVTRLNQKFEETVSYLPAGRRAVAQTKYRKAKDSMEKALERGEAAQVMNDFEEIEAWVDEIATSYGPLEPPKTAFDDVVSECLQFNRYAAEAAAEQGKGYEKEEVAKSIEVLREQGEKAFVGHDQKTYTDSINALCAIREHARKVIADAMGGDHEPDEAERAAGLYDACLDAVGKLRSLAQANNNKDVLDRLRDLDSRVLALQDEIGKNPKGAASKLNRIFQELQQINNQMIARSRPGSRDGGDIPIEI